MQVDNPRSTHGLKRAMDSRFPSITYHCLSSHGSCSIQSGIGVQGTHHAAENGREDVEDKVHIDLQEVGLVGAAWENLPGCPGAKKDGTLMLDFGDQHNKTSLKFFRWIHVDPGLTSNVDRNDIGYRWISIFYGNQMETCSGL